MTAPKVFRLRGMRYAWIESHGCGGRMQHCVVTEGMHESDLRMLLRFARWLEKAAAWAHYANRCERARDALEPREAK